MDIQEYNLNDQARFDDFVIKCPLGTIHQTHKWGLFQAKSNQRDKFWMLALEDRKITGKEVNGTALIIRQKLPFGLSWLYCPRGPLIDITEVKCHGLLCKKIHKIAKQERAVFLRVDPPIATCDVDNVVKAKNCYNWLKMKEAHAQYMPEHTLVINLEQSEEEILKKMKQKGRYNIKVAQKHGVQVHLKCIREIDTFFKLFHETSARDKFNGHPKEYYKNMLDILGPQNCKLWIAYYKEKPLATAIVIYFKDTATYYFGASSSQERNVMAPYLLHWEIMKDAKAHGYKKYDLFGIAPLNEKGKPVKEHPWASVTDFKLKFGGEKVSYLPAHEVIFKPFWFTIIKLVKKLKGLS